MPRAIVTVRSVTAVWGALRVALGATALVAPRAASTLWVGTLPDAAGAALGRALGGRDVSLGVGVVTSALTGRTMTPWILAGGGADAIDAVATLMVRTQLPPKRRELVIGASTGSALLAAGLALSACADSGDRDRRSVQVSRRA